jgi:hypothetical protein
MSGVTSPVASTTFLRASGLVVYDRARYAYASSYKNATGHDIFRVMNSRRKQLDIPSLACIAVAGATAGAATTIAACPFELTKQAAQISGMLADHASTKGTIDVSHSYEGKGTFNTARTIVRNRGVFGLYSGFQFQLFRDTLGSSIYFMAYESSKKALSNSDWPNEQVAVLASGAVCGVAAWPFIYAIDSAKAVYQRECLLHRKGEHVPIPKIGFFDPQRYKGEQILCAYRHFN